MDEADRNLSPEELKARAVKIDTSEVSDDAELCNRFTCTATAVHSDCTTGDSGAFRLAFTDRLETDHQAYPRRMKVTNEWQKLDLGWIPPEDVGHVIIENPFPKQIKKLTPEEKAAIDAREAQLGYDGVAVIRTRPGRFSVFEPIDAAGLALRGEGEPFYVMVRVYPR